MAYNGLNLENVKNQNRSSILKLLNDHGPMSRKDISARLGLTPASVTTLCAELLAQNILVELGEVQQGNRAGRRKILLGINYTYRYRLTLAAKNSKPLRLLLAQELCIFAKEKQNRGVNAYADVNSYD